MTEIFKFELGAKARDEVTGYEGTITARYEFINGCKRYGLETMKDGDVKEFVFDEDRLQVLEEKSVNVTPSRTGGSRLTPPRTGAQ